MTEQPDQDELLDALGAGVLPEQLPDWDRAITVLPIFPLCRSLFSTSRADTTLKVVLLLALAKAEGRFSRERVRTLIPHFDSEKTDRLLTSLYQGGWLHLRASDSTYRIPDGGDGEALPLPGPLPELLYWDVFEPCVDVPEEPVANSLVDDVSDIWRDLTEGLSLFDAGDRGGACSHWKFTHRVHWGEHLVGALRALHLAGR